MRDFDLLAEFAAPLAAHAATLAAQPAYQRTRRPHERARGRLRYGLCQLTRALHAAAPFDDYALVGVDEWTLEEQEALAALINAHAEFRGRASVFERALVTGRPECEGIDVVIDLN